MQQDPLDAWIRQPLTNLLIGLHPYLPGSSKAFFNSAQAGLRPACISILFIFYCEASNSLPNKATIESLSAAISPGDLISFLGSLMLIALFAGALLANWLGKDCGLFQVTSYLGDSIRFAGFMSLPVLVYGLYAFWPNYALWQNVVMISAFTIAFLIVTVSLLFAAWVTYVLRNPEQRRGLSIMLGGMPKSPATGIFALLLTTTLANMVTS